MRGYLSLLCFVLGLRGNHTERYLDVFTSSIFTSTTVVATPTSATASAPATTSTSCTLASTVAVTFNELVTTVYGDSIKLVGSISQLGLWNTGSALAPSASGNTSSKPLWSLTTSFPAGTSFQYKFIDSRCPAAALSLGRAIQIGRIPSLPTVRRWLPSVRPGAEIVAVVKV